MSSSTRRAPTDDRRAQNVPRPSTQALKRPSTQAPKHPSTQAPKHPSTLQSPMLVHTDYLWFNTKKRQEFIRITDEVAGIVRKSGVKEGTVLISAMHITASVY